MELLCIHLHLLRYHRHHPEVHSLPEVQDLPEVIHQEGFDQKILRSHSHKNTLVTKVDFIQKFFPTYECLFVLNTRNKRIHKISKRHNFFKGLDHDLSANEKKYFDYI